MKAFRCCIAALLLCGVAGSTVNFGEADYLAAEGGDTFMRVSLVKTGSNAVNITIQVTPMTYAKYYFQPGSPTQFPTSDEAEKEDFSPEVLNITFEPSGGNDVDYVYVHIINDDLFEQDEEFVLVLEVFTDESDVSVSRSVSVGRISDDPNDRLVFSLFAATTSSGDVDVNESIGLVTDLLFIEVSGAAENALSIGLTFETRGRTSTADFSVAATTFGLHPPMVNRTAVPISIVNDDIPEGENERFTVRLIEDADYDLGTTQFVTFNIIDDDPVHFGLTMTEFEVIEGGSPSVCVAIFDVGEIDRNIDVKIFIEPGDVAGNAKVELDDDLLLLDNTKNTSCVSLKTTDDEEPQFPRVFTIKVEDDSPSGRHLHTISPDTATVTIIDNDRSPDSPNILNTKPINGDKDLLIQWVANSTELKPIDSYIGTVHVLPSAATPTTTKRDVTGENTDIIKFQTANSKFVLSNADLSKEYNIIVCAINSFGSACSEPFKYFSTIVPEEVGLDEEEKDDDDEIDIWIIVILIVVPLLILGCCLLLLCFFCCFLRCGRSKNYYPAETEKKHAKEFEKYRESRSESSPSDFDSDLDSTA